jgi:hypothetical protein
MKKGKSVKISGFKDFKINYGTVDFKSMKSVYLVIQAWVEPIVDLESWSSVVNNLRRDVKHKLLDSIDLNIFNNQTIVDLDIRTSGIQLGKRSFMNLEITFFLDSHIDFKSEALNKSLVNICKYIIKKSFKSNRYFSFHQSKNPSLVKLP